MSASSIAMVRSGAHPDLSSIRKSRNISLEQISDNTKISRRYLEAIESCDFDCLPGGVYATSYIRQYARAVDYDEWELLARYEAVAAPPTEPVPESAAPRLLGLFPIPAPFAKLFQ